MNPEIERKIARNLATLTEEHGQRRSMEERLAVARRKAFTLPVGGLVANDDHTG